MKDLPFTLYDFLGYAVPGYLLVNVIFLINKQYSWIVNNNSLSITSLVVILSYIVGQIIAGLSAFLLERVIIGKWLGRPSTNLLETESHSILSFIFPGYFTPLAEQHRINVIKKAKKDGISVSGETIFFHAFGKIKSDDQVMKRLYSFLCLYGFCRNTTFVFILLFFYSLFLQFTGENLLLLLPFLFIGLLGMFYRYLKFFRQYSYEVFIGYLYQSK